MLECFRSAAGDVFESGVECFVLVFLLVVAVVHESAELGSGGTVLAEFGQFFGVYPDATFGAVGCVNDFDFSVHFCVLKWFWCSRGWSGFVVGFSRGVCLMGFGMRTRVRERTAGEHTNRESVADAGKGEASTLSHRCECVGVLGEPA